MKIDILLLSILFLLLSCSPAPSTWKVDSALRFQLSYIPDGKVNDEGTLPVKSLGLSPDYLPDIDNIILGDIKGLGFTLPDRINPKNYKLYLKLYCFPDGLKSKDICSDILKTYHLSDLPDGGSYLTRYVSENANVTVKYGFIDLKDRKFTMAAPFPSFHAGKDPAFAAVFAKNTLFYSLYLNPVEPVGTQKSDDLARKSAGGVIEFHKSLLAHYRKTLKETGGPEPDRYYYFRDEIMKTTIRLPKTPLVFSNWRDLPMPTNPSKHFLTGLLLIYCTHDDESGLAASSVFEAGSIIRLE